MIENLFGSKAKIKILRFFFEYPLAKRNVREVALECKLGFGVASISLKELENVGIIRKERSGREIIYSLDTSSNFFSPLNEIFRIEKSVFSNLPFFYRNLLSDIVTSTRRMIDLCVLFGSLVTGSYTSRSDVDLFFVTENEEEVRDACIKIEDRYGVKIQIVAIEKSEIKKFKKTSLYRTLKKDSFVLFDRENLKEKMGL
jgi:predicted nucleotidyltransferase